MSSKINSKNKELLSSMSDLYKGDVGIVLGCSPYVGLHDQSLLREVCSKNKVISIKQSYHMLPDLVDIHIYNCCNIQKYNYLQNKPISLEVSSASLSLHNFHLFFKIRERDKRKSVSWISRDKKNFDEIEKWSISNSKDPFVRPYGPGIMTEIVFYMCEYLGLSKIVLIGCDNQSMGGVTHFYRNSKNLPSLPIINDPHAGSPLIKFEEEKSIFLESMTYWQKWLESKGVEIYNLSEFNNYPSSIKKVKINELSNW